MNPSYVVTFRSILWSHFVALKHSFTHSVHWVFMTLRNRVPFRCTVWSHFVAPYDPILKQAKVTIWNTQWSHFVAKMVPFRCKGGPILSQKWSHSGANYREKKGSLYLSIYIYILIDRGGGFRRSLYFLKREEERVFTKNLAINLPFDYDREAWKKKDPVCGGVLARSPELDNVLRLTVTERWL